MILYGLTGSLAKGIGYSVLAGGNPFVGGALFGADLGRYEKDKLQDKGVDTETATKAGLITGVTNAVGMALPASLGTSYLKSRPSAPWSIPQLTSLSSRRLSSSWITRTIRLSPKSTILSIL